MLRVTPVGSIVGLWGIQVLWCSTGPTQVQQDRRILVGDFERSTRILINSPGETAIVSRSLAFIYCGC